MLPEGELAADSCCCLSVLVLAHASSERHGTSMSVAKFAITRISRLYPMRLLSVVIATAYFLGKSLLTPENVPLVDILASGLTGALVLPFFGSSVALSTEHAAFPINGPLWSLFFEFLISFVWASVFAVLTFRRTLVLAFLCAAILLTVGLMRQDLLLGDHSHDFIWGVPRVGVSFFLGLIIYHIHKLRALHLKWPLWAVCLILILPMMLPRTPGVTDVMLDAVFIFALSPMIVLLGAEVSVNQQIKSIADLGGELSYPIYVLHFPIFACLNGAVQIFGLDISALPFITLCFCTIMIGSWLALIWYDRPVRRLLKKE